MTPCGPNTCDASHGEYCGNESCGVCCKEGEPCDQDSVCAEQCGDNHCGVDEHCCDLGCDQVRGNGKERTVSSVILFSRRVCLKKGPLQCTPLRVPCQNSMCGGLRGHNLAGSHNTLNEIEKVRTTKIRQQTFNTAGSLGSSSSP